MAEDQPSLASRMTKDGKPVEQPSAEASAPAADPTEGAKEPVANDQVDGVFSTPGGNILPEPEYSVHVTLANMQEDPDNPLYSIKSFNELDL
jgi:ATP-dependent RNA helicase DDX19/DBP5